MVQEKMNINEMSIDDIMDRRKMIKKFRAYVEGKLLKEKIYFTLWLLIMGMFFMDILFCTISENMYKPIIVTFLTLAIIFSTLKTAQHYVNIIIWKKFLKKLSLESTFESISLR